MTLATSQRAFWTADPWGTVAPPSAPALSATWSTNTATISWTDPGNVSSYYLYRNGVLHQTLGGNTQSFNDTGLTAGTKYTYQISAQNPAGTSPLSADLNVYPGNKVAFQDAEDVVYSAATLVWAVNDYSGWTTVRLLRDGVQVYSGPHNGPREYTDVTLFPETTYTYTIEALNGAATVSSYTLNVTTTGTDIPYIVDITESYTTDTTTINWYAPLPEYKPYDVLLVVLGRSINNSTPTVPAGWSQIIANAGAANNLYTVLWRRMQRGDTQRTLLLNTLVGGSYIVKVYNYRGAHIGYNTQDNNSLPFIPGPTTSRNTTETTVPFSTTGSLSYSGVVFAPFSIGVAANTTGQQVTPADPGTTVVEGSSYPASTVSTRVWVAALERRFDGPEDAANITATLSVAGTITWAVFWFMEPYTLGVMHTSAVAGGAGASTTITASAVGVPRHCAALLTSETTAYTGATPTIAPNTGVAGTGGWGTPIVVYDSGTTHPNMRMTTWLIPNVSSTNTGFIITYPVSVTGRMLTTNVLVGATDLVVDNFTSTVYTAATTAPTSTVAAGAKTIQVSFEQLFLGNVTAVQSYSTIPATWSKTMMDHNTSNYWRIANGATSNNFQNLSTLSWAETAQNKTFNPTLATGYPILREVASFKSASGKARLGKYDPSAAKTQFAAFGIPL